jgi:hypothetical protein
MVRTATEDKFLTELVKDCITYRLDESEALQYIQIRFNQPLSIAAYKHRKSRVMAEDNTQIWLNHFTRIGFVEHHKKQIEIIEAVQKDSIRQFFIETNRSSRDEDIIKSLKSDIRENTKLLSELGLGTPIISAIKAKMNEERNNKNSYNYNNNNASTLQVR